MENLYNNLEQATEHIEQLELPNVDEMNLILNTNRNTNASLNIELLHDLERREINKAKEKLVNGLISGYQRSELHGMGSDGTEQIVDSNNLANEFESFDLIARSIFLTN